MNPATIRPVRFKEIVEKGLRALASNKHVSAFPHNLRCGHLTLAKDGAAILFHFNTPKGNETIRFDLNTNQLALYGLGYTTPDKIGEKEIAFLLFTLDDKKREEMRISANCCACHLSEQRPTVPYHKFRLHTTSTYETKLEYRSGLIPFYFAAVYPSP